MQSIATVEFDGRLRGAQAGLPQEERREAVDDDVRGRVVGRCVHLGDHDAVNLPDTSVTTTPPQPAHPCHGDALIQSARPRALRFRNGSLWIIN